MTVLEEMDLLLQEGVRTACDLLEKHGRFVAFSVELGHDGQVRPTVAHTGVDQPYADAHMMLTRVVLRFRAGRGEFRAVALVSDERLLEAYEGGPREAIRVQVEHTEAAPVVCRVHFTLAGGKVEPGETISEAGKPQIFIRGEAV